MDFRAKLRNLNSFLREPFQSQGCTDTTLVLIFLVINLVVVSNFITHNPEIGHDTRAHLSYMAALPQGLPDSDDSYEFFSPPFAYVIPAITTNYCKTTDLKIGGLYSGWSKNQPGRRCSLVMGAKVAQLMNVFLSLGLTFLLTAILKFMWPDQIWPRRLGLLLMGSMTAYFVVFSHLRGEAYIALFAVWAVYLFLQAVRHPEALTWKRGIPLGIVLGLGILSRQWGFFVVFGLAVLAGLIYLLKLPHYRQMLSMLITSFAVAAVVGGWFYLHLFVSYGNFAHFNRADRDVLDPGGFAFSSQPASFYYPPWSKAIFDNPVYPTLNNRYVPVMYTSLWGDYWGVLSYVGPDRFIKNTHYYSNGVGNGATMVPYQARINLLSLLPTLVLVGGLAEGGRALLRLLRRQYGDELPQRDLLLALVFLIAIVSVAGHVWFAIRYVSPDFNGDNLKAAHILHTFVLWIILGMAFLDRIKQRLPQAFTWLSAGLLVVFLHNLPAMFTRFSIFMYTFRH